MTARRRRASATLHGLALAAALAGCADLISVDERYPGGPDADGGGDPSGDAAADPDGGGGGDAATGPLKPQTLGQFADPVLAMGENELLVSDQSGNKSTIVLISKSDPTHPRTLYDQPSASSATRVSTIGVARAQAWFTTVDGKLHRMSLEGKNPTIVDDAPSDILAESAKTLWTVSPDFTTNAPTLRWIGADLLSQVPEATLSFGQPVMFAFGSDDELVFSSRKTNGQWTLHRWRPFATEPLLTLATFEAYPSWVAVDPQRVLVYGQDEGTIVSWSRTTPQASPTTVVVDVPAPVSIKSDGTKLVLRSQTSLSTCSIANCAATMQPIATPSTFTKARYLEIDASFAYFFHAKSDTGPMTLVRVPR